MRRCLVLGSGGAGKTTFSVALAGATGLPVVHLDRHFWQPGWRPLPPEAWEARVQELVRRPAWIMDGNYGGTLEIRLAAADTVILLDTPRLQCLAGVVRRRWAWGGRSRPSLPEGCPERITLGFLHWIWTYPSRRRPALLARFEELGGDTAVHVFRGRREQETFLATVAADR
jgi:adenylate kinase family enzyme